MFTRSESQGLGLRVTHTVTQVALEGINPGKTLVPPGPKEWGGMTQVESPNLLDSLA